MIGWAIEAMVGSTLLMLLVLAVRRPVTRWFGAEWAYALWLLPVLRLVIPPLPANPLPVSTVTVVMPVMERLATPAPAAVAAGGSGEWLAVLLAIWAGGAAIFAIWQQSTYSAFQLHLGPDATPADPPIYGGIRVVESDAVDGPIAVGLVDRRIVVPLDFAIRYTAGERRLALEHELIHHRRFDLWWNFVALFVLALNWFNPIAHFAFRAFRADQELACDAAVTRRSPEHRHDYACALVKSASRPGLIAACPLNHAAFLKRRLKMMKQHRGGWGRTAGGIAALALVGTAGLALSSPGIAKPDKDAVPRLVLRTGENQASFIDAADLATLKEKCGRRTSAADGDTSQVIFCDAKAAADPEIRAIMARTDKKIREHVAASMPSAAEMAAIEASVAKAQAAVAAMPPIPPVPPVAPVAPLAPLAPVPPTPPAAPHMAHVEAALARAHAAMARAEVDRTRHMAIARAALERARASIAAIDVDAIRTAAIAPAMAAARVRIADAHLTPEERSEIREAMEEARREIRSIDLHAEMRQADEELKRELQALDRED
jgi:beta-lactamase regulating signal transducer with metallopeptidase domain